jgi:hypothetical protein
MMSRRWIISISLGALMLAACAPLATDTPLPPVADATASPTPRPSFTPQPRSAQISEIRNSVEARRDTAVEWQAASEGAQIVTGGGVKTGNDARARLHISDGAIVRLAASTTFTLTELSPSPNDPVTRFVLEAGQIWIQAGKALGGVFEIETPTGTAAVRGSLMSVEFYPADGHMIATCLEGACRLTSATSGNATDLTAGQQAAIPAYGGDPTPPQPLDSVRLAGWVAEFPEAQAAAAQVAPGPSPTPTQTFTPPPPNTFVSAEGSVQASSIFSAEFPASLAVDGDRATSWFSAGPAADGGVSVFRWTGARDDVITSLAILSNAEHADASVRTGFGFESLTVQILDAGGAVVFEQTVSLGGTPDPDITFTPNVVGREVVLSFTGHEDPTCGGISELQVGVAR